MKVFITVDVELWPDSWENYQAQFSDAYARYILGRTSRGVYGLPFQLQVAKDHGLRFVFFVESLFAAEFGIEPLGEIVQSIREAGQDLQLHAHPEWARHASRPILETGRRYLLSQFDESEQFRLIDTGLQYIADAGGDDIRAFRAGSFAGNKDTLAAVARAGLDVDSSFRLDSFGTDGGDACVSVSEYPLSAFHDWPGHWRPLQLASCSTRELIYVLRAAKEQGWDSVVILSHSAELLNGARSRPDPVVVSRFEQLCRFLADHPSEYETSWFRDQTRNDAPRIPAEPIRSSPWRTLLRASEQSARRIFG